MIFSTEPSVTCPPLATDDSLVAIPIKSANHSECENMCQNLIGCSRFALNGPINNETCLLYVSDDQSNSAFQLGSDCAPLSCK